MSEICHDNILAPDVRFVSVQEGDLANLPKFLPVQNGVCVPTIHINSLGFRSILTKILKDLYLPQERFFASLARASVARAERFAVEVPL